MNCANHPEVSAVAYCRTCGKAMCANCTHQVRGVVYCENCLAERLGGVLPPPSALPPTLTPRGDRESRLPSPGVAAALGLIPGVGAMYNGQFMKGVAHVLAFVCLIWMADHFGPIMVPIFAYFFYLIFDAYKTAHAIEMGQPVPDPFGLERMFGAGINTTTARSMTPVPPTAGNATAPPQDLSCSYASSRAPMGAFVLIVLGVLFLLDNLGLFEFHWVHRLWPVILIVIGVWLFAKRWNRLGD